MNNQTKNYVCYGCGEPNDYTLGEYYCPDCESKSALNKLGEQG